MDEPDNVSNFVFYDWTNPDKQVYSLLPEWLRKVIDQGKDQPRLAVVKTELEFDDDIPM